MSKDNKNSELDNTDKKLYISVAIWHEADCEQFIIKSR